MLETSNSRRNHTTTTSIDRRKIKTRLSRVRQSATPSIKRSIPRVKRNTNTILHHTNHLVLRSLKCSPTARSPAFSDLSSKSSRCDPENLPPSSRTTSDHGTSSLCCRQSHHQVHSYHTNSDDGYFPEQDTHQATSHLTHYGAPSQRCQHPDHQHKDPPATAAMLHLRASKTTSPLTTAHHLCAIAINTAIRAVVATTATTLHLRANVHHAELRLASHLTPSPTTHHAFQNFPLLPAD